MNSLLKKGTKVRLALSNDPAGGALRGKILRIRKESFKVDDLVVETSDGRQVWINGQHHKGKYKVGDQITLNSSVSGRIIRKEKRTLEIEDFCIKITEGLVQGWLIWVNSEIIKAVRREEDGSCTILI